MSKKNATSKMRRLMRQRKNARRPKRGRERPPGVMVCSERIPEVGDKLVMAGAYFRGDKAGGISFVITPATVAAGEDLVGTVRTMIADYDAAEAKPTDLLEQLEILGARGIHTFRQYEHLVALANICWLELRGHLTTDEHNRVMWAVETVAP